MDTPIIEPKKAKRAKKVLIPEAVESLARLTTDLKSAAKTLSEREAKFLVDGYYTAQKNRIIFDAQCTKLKEAGLPTSLIEGLAAQMETIEDQIKKTLGTYTEFHPIGSWMRSHVGIGPVTAAGLLAMIDIKKAPTVGHIWNYAGLNPKIEWKKGQKRPYNATLKTLCYHIGEGFIKTKNNPNSFYGKHFDNKKAEYRDKNEAGGFKDRAAEILAEKKWTKGTVSYKAYMAGKLPDGQINAMARRWTVKLFLSHLHQEWYHYEFKEWPPKPYAIDILKHAHFIEPQSHAA